MTKGSPLVEMADKLGIDKKTVYRAIEKHFPDIRKEVDGTYFLTEDELSWLYQELQKPQGVTVNQLADELQMEPARIRERIKRILPGITRTTYGYFLTEEQADEIRRWKDSGVKAEKGSLWWRIERVLGGRMSMRNATKRMRMGYNALYRCRRCNVYPPVKKLVLIADFLNCSVDYLVGHQVKPL